MKKLTITKMLNIAQPMSLCRDNYNSHLNHIISKLLFAIKSIKEIQSCCA